MRRGNSFSGPNGSLCIPIIFSALEGHPRGHAIQFFAHCKVLRFTVSHFVHQKGTRRGTSPFVTHSKGACEGTSSRFSPHSWEPFITPSCILGQFREALFYPIYYSDLDLNLKRYIFPPPSFPNSASNYRAHLRCQSPPKFPDMFKHLKRRMPWVIFKTACGWMFHDSYSCRGFFPTLAIRFIRYTPHLHKRLAPLDSESYCILNNK